MVQIIFYDIDGTLRDPASGITPASVPVLMERLRKQGILQVVSTGRHLSEIRNDHLLDGLSFDAYITLNGQCCWGKDGFRYENPIPPEDIRRVVEQIDRTPYPCAFCEKELMYINFIDSRVEQALGSIGSHLPPVMEIHRALEHPVFQLAPFTRPGDPDPRTAAPSLCFTRWHPSGCDITPPNGSKAAAIQKMLEFYRIPPEYAMAFGDSDNDIEMLQYVGTGVAMGNGAPHVREIADYVTLPLLEDGILHAMKHFHVLEG